MSFLERGSYINIVKQKGEMELYVRYYLKSEVGEILVSEDRDKMFAFVYFLDVSTDNRFIKLDDKGNLTFTILE